MADLKTLWLSLDSDPKFAELSYEAQLAARNKLATSLLSGDPEFLALSDTAKVSALKKLVVRPPALADKKSQAEFSDLVAKADAGDKKAEAEITALIANRQASMSGVIANVGIKATGKVLSGLGAENQGFRRDFLVGSDADKIAQYLAMRADESGSIYELGQKTAGVAGFAAGIMDAQPLFMSLPNRVGDVVKFALEAKASSTAGLLKTMLLRSVVPQLAETAAAGLLGVAQQNVLAQLSAQPELYTNSLGKVARAFTQGAALDFVAGMVGRELLPQALSLVGKTFRGMGGAAKATGATIDRLIEELPTSAGLAPELSEMLPRVTRATTWFRDNALRATQNGIETTNLRPLDRTLLAAQAMPKTTFAPLESGDGWEVWMPKIGAKGDQVLHGTFKTLSGLQDALAREAWQMTHLSGAFPDAASQATFLTSGRWLVNRGTTLAELDATLASKSAKDAAEEAARRAKYVGPSRRGYVSLDEAESLGRRLAGQGAAIRVDLGEIDPATVKRLASGKSLLGPDEVTRKFVPDSGGNGILVLNRIADESVVAQADALVAEAIASGSSETPESLRAMYLLEQGFDGAKLADGSYLSFSPQPAVKMLVAAVDAKTGALARITTNMPGSRMKATSVTLDQGEVVSAGKLRARPDKFASAFQGVFTGRVMDTRAKELIRMASGIPESEIGKGIEIVSRPVRDGDVSFKIERTESGYRLSYPDTIASPSDQRKFIQSFTASLEKLGYLDRVKTSVQGVTEALRSASKMRPFSAAGTAVKGTWLAGVAEDLGGSLTKTSDGFALNLPGLGPRGLRTLDEAEELIAASMLDERTLTRELASAGWSVTKTSEGFELRRGLDVIRARSTADAAMSAGIGRSVVSNRFAPETVLLSSNQIGLVFKKKILTGSTTSALKALGGFADVATEGDLRTIYTASDGTLLRRSALHGTIRLEMPSLASSVDFESISDARRFLEDVKVRDLDAMRKVAARKGFSLAIDPKTGSYRLSDGRGHSLFSNADDLSRALSDVPDGVGLRDVFDGLDPKFGAEAKRVFDEVAREKPDLARAFISSSFADDVSDWKLSTGIETPELQSSNEFARVMRANFASFDWYADSTLNKLKMPELKNRLGTLRESMTAAHVKTNEAHRLLESVFSDGGKMLDRKRRVALKLLREAGSEGSEVWNKVAAKVGAPSDRERLILDRVRRIFGERKGANVTGLAAQFGINFSEFEENYVSRIRASLESPEGRRAFRDSVSTNDFLSFVWKDAVPSEVKVFFENLRLDEIAQFATDDDLLSVAMKYSTLGYRKLYLQDSWKELSTYLKTNKGTIPQDVWNRLEQYRMISLGIYKPDSIRMAETAGVGLMRALGAGEEQAQRVGKDLLKYYFSLSYATTLGFRPMSAIRNALQVFTTFSARFDDVGVSWTRRAITELEKRGPAFVEYLRKVGVLPGTAPVVSDLLTSTTMLGKFTTKALGWFKNADEFSRATAYLALDLRYGEAVEKLSRGVFGQGAEALEKFKRYSGLHLLADTNPEVVAKSIEALGKGVTSDGRFTSDAIAQGRHVFASEAVRQTMFDWNASNAPGFYSRSLLGRLFGRYGTYSAGYRANIWRSLSNGTFADKAAFAVRFIGNNLAIKGILTSLGIASSDFTPGIPALFGGGPDFDLAVSLLQAPSTSFKGEQARAEALRMLSPVVPKAGGGLKANFPSLLPLSMQYRFAEKASRALGNDDLYGALLAITMTPMEKIID